MCCEKLRDLVFSRQRKFLKIQLYGFYKFHFSVKMPVNRLTSLHTENFLLFCAEKLCINKYGWSLAGSQVLIFTL